jgi:hypothetical protein
VHIAACIEGENADGAGAHVTFTQDTWEHIYAVKDKNFPDERIVGWYHSHPGFGIFLSEHDTFIHKNFFSSPGQIAWVFDPHSDEEGCFGWVGGQIERLSRVAVLDRRGGEPAENNAPSESSAARARTVSASQDDDDQKRIAVRVRRAEVEAEDDRDTTSLEDLVAKVFLYLAAVLLGGVLSWYFYPHIVVMPVLVDPMTGKPLDAQAATQLLEQLQGDKAGKVSPADAGQGAVPQGSEKKGDNARAK